MKIHKKIGLGLGLAIVLMGVGSLAPAKTLAFTVDDFDHATYKTSQSSLVIDATIGGQPVKFIDKNPLDNGTLGKANYKPDSNDFCSNTALGASGDKGITLLPTGDMLKGILEANINVDFKVPRTGACETYTNTLVFTKGADDSWTATVTPPITYAAAWVDRSDIKVTGSDGSSVIVTDSNWDGKWVFTGTADGSCTVTVDGFKTNNNDLQPGYQVDWNASKSVANIVVQRLFGTACSSYAAPGFQETDHKFSIGDPANARIAFEWVDSDTIQRIDRPSDWTFSKAPAPPGSGGDAGAAWFLRTNNNKSCKDYIVVLPGDIQMKLYENTSDNRTKVRSPIDSNCWLYNTIEKMSPGSADVDGWAQQVPSNFVLGLGKQNNQSLPPGSVTGSNDACYNSGWALSWLACPVVTAAQTSANAMYGFVEDQLKFCVSQSNTDTTSCKGGDSLGSEHDSVHSAWSNFRILVSGLVVILLLVMVISQAIGSGPFDAYTVRKMLPRLVMGVILIQISWPLFSWVVNTVDHLGVGLADIMYAPFGGADALNLNSVMEPFTGKAMLFSWVGIPALVIFGVVAPFIVIGLILTVLAAIFVGFLTLLFRKILIILALIFVPVALISWMMPNDGLRKYWKLWWDNFIKALMMFPLIIAIIAGGRIFAKIGSGGHDFVGFFIVLVGFFGPLFILPKTFKWGGTVMMQAGNAMTKAQERTMKKPKEFLGERQKGWSAERTRQSQERYSRNEGFNPRRFWRRPIDLVKSGQYDPTLWGRRRQQAMTAYTAKGAESEEADVKNADARARVLFDQVDDHDALARAMAEGNENYQYATHDGVTHRLGRMSAAEMQAGLNAVSRFGGGTNMRYLDDRVDRLRNAVDANGNPDAEHRAMAKKFLDANVQSLQPKLKHMYYGTGRNEGVDNMVDAMSENSFVGMEGAEMEAVIESLSQRIAANPADVRSVERLSKVLTFYDSAMHNENIRPNVVAGISQAVEAFADGGNLESINGIDAAGNPILNAAGQPTGRNRVGRPGINHGVATDPRLAHEVGQITGHIDINGHYTP